MYIKNINRYAKIFIVPRIVSSFKIRTIIIMINISVINIKKKNITYQTIREEPYILLPSLPTLSI